MAISIRSAFEKDYDAICALLYELDCFLARQCPDVFQPVDGPGRPRESIASMTNSESSTILLAEESGKGVGLAGLRIARPSPVPVYRQDPYLMIDYLVVTESRRRTGIGGRLCTAAAQWGRARGLRHVELQVNAANPRALRFYERYGFAPVHHRLRMEL